MRAPSSFISITRRPNHNEWKGIILCELLQSKSKTSRDGRYSHRRKEHCIAGDIMYLSLLHDEVPLVTSLICWNSVWSSDEVRLCESENPRNPKDDVER